MRCLTCIWLWLACICAPTALAQIEPAYQGFDLVSYQQQKQAQKGNRAHQLTYKNRTYWFSHSQNRKLFQANPAQYMPRFDGLCAYDQSLNKQSLGDPLQFVVLQEKLYWFKDANAKRQWLRQAKENIALAERFWAGN